MCTAVKIVHVPCGNTIAVTNALDDHGSFEMLCQKCNKWVELHLQCIMYPDEFTAGTEVTYTDVSDKHPLS